MHARSLAAASLSALVLLSACNRNPATGDSAAGGNEAVTADADGGVTRNVIEPAAPPAPAPAPAAIQIQPGPRGSQVTLNRVAVTGDVLTVALTFQGTTCCAYIPVDQVSIIDDATAQRISVLKDNGGQWMAAPMDSGSAMKELRIGNDNSPTQVWFKFPAPPATSKTVSLNIPGVAPFDAVPITR